MGTPNKLAVGYFRVSTEDQANEGVSLGAQEHKIRAWAELNGYEIVGMFSDEGISGKSFKNRPGFKAALETATTKQAALVVYSLSRMSRSIRDTLEISDRLERAGADLVTIVERLDTTTATGRIFFVLTAAFAQWEREIIAERTMAAMNHKRKNGEALGNAPFGFRDDRDRRGPGGPAGLLVPVEAELTALHRIMALSETMNFGQIATTLNDEGVPTRSGVPWTRGTLRKIVRFYGTDQGLGLLARVPAAPVTSM